MSQQSSHYASFSSPENRQLGSYLLEAGLISHAQIEVVLNDQQMMHEMRFGEVLVARGWIKSETIDFVMRHVVEPDRARNSQTPAQPQVQETPTEVTAPPEPTSPTSPPQARIVARARSLDGDFEFDIVQEPSQNLTTPAIRSTDSGHSRNERRSLSSIPDEDGVNWAG